MFVGYVGVRNVYAATTPTGSPCFYTLDPAGEEEPRLEETGEFMGAWRKAAAFVRKHGGVVVNAPPARPRRPRRPDLKVRGCKVLETPWGEPTEFENRRKAKAYARRHRRQIAEAWDY
jgi:hypothetical protein